MFIAFIFLLICLTNCTSKQTTLNYYEVLGIPKSASSAAIKKKYRELAKQYHPDRHQGSNLQESQNQFITISNAYEVLIDDKKRKEYDDSLKFSSHTSHSSSSSFGRYSEASKFFNRRQQHDATEKSNDGNNDDENVFVFRTANGNFYYKSSVKHGGGHNERFDSGFYTQSTYSNYTLASSILIMLLQFSFWILLSLSPYIFLFICLIWLLCFPWKVKIDDGEEQEDERSNGHKAGNHGSMKNNNNNNNNNDDTNIVRCRKGTIITTTDGTENTKSANQMKDSPITPPYSSSASSSVSPCISQLLSKMSLDHTTPATTITHTPAVVNLNNLFQSSSSSSSSLSSLRTSLIELVNIQERMDLLAMRHMVTIIVCDVHLLPIVAEIALKFTKDPLVFAKYTNGSVSLHVNDSSSSTTTTTPTTTSSFSYQRTNADKSFLSSSPSSSSSSDSSHDDFPSYSYSYDIIATTKSGGKWVGLRVKNKYSTNNCSNNKDNNNFELSPDLVNFDYNHHNSFVSLETSSSSIPSSSSSSSFKLVFREIDNWIVKLLNGETPWNITSMNRDGTLGFPIDRFLINNNIH